MTRREAEKHAALTRTVSVIVFIPEDYEKAVDFMPSLNVSLFEIAKTAIHEHIDNAVGMYRTVKEKANE